MDVKYKIMNRISYENLIMFEYLGRILLAGVNSLYFISIKINRRNKDAYLVLITTENSISTHMFYTSHNRDLKKDKRALFEMFIFCTISYRYMVYWDTLFLRPNIK